MLTSRLINVDLRIAQVREQIASGQANEIAQIELTQLLAERAKIVQTMALTLTGSSRPSSASLAGRGE